MVEVRDDGLTLEVPEKINFNVETFKNFTHSYDKERDVLFAYSVPRRPAVSMDVGGHLWLRLDPETGEVLGLEIEDFEQVFLVKYPEMSLGWGKVKPRIIKVKRGNNFAEYLQMLMLFVKDILKEHPYQQGFAPT